MTGLDQVDGVKLPAGPFASNAPNRSQITKAIHDDDHLIRTPDVAPPLHVSTTFRYEDDTENLKPISEWEVFKHVDQTPTDTHIYSRLSTPTTTRLEAVLSSLLGGRALTYTSGLSAFHALVVFLNPRRIAIGDGYQGVHGVIGIHQKLSGVQKIPLNATDAEWDAAGLGEGDVVHVETPLNPTGEARDLATYAQRAHSRGAYVTVDATFGPPPLQDPFAQGADVIMHSGTKYIGGHSDMLCGILAVKRDEWWWQLYRERLLLGSVMGSMEGWLGLRSMRTLELRVRRQSENATELVRRIDTALSGSASGKNGEADGLGRDPDASSISVSPDDESVVRSTVDSIQHASLQIQRDPSAALWLPKQMPSGYGPCFSVWLKTVRMAKTFPSKLELFHHATSLGGVESLIEWRTMSDKTVDPRVLRVSVGIENIEDLWADVVQALRGVLSINAEDGESIER